MSEFYLDEYGSGNRLWVRRDLEGGAIETVVQDDVVASREHGERIVAALNNTPIVVSPVQFSPRMKGMLQDELHRIQRNLNMHKDHQELQGALVCNRELQVAMNDARLIGMTPEEIKEAREGGHIPGGHVPF